MKTIALVLSLFSSLALGAQSSPGYQPTAWERCIALSVLAQYPIDHVGLYGLFYRHPDQPVHWLDSWRTWGNGQPVTTWQELGFHRSERSGRGCPRSDPYWRIGCLLATSKHTPTKRISFLVLDFATIAALNADGAGLDPAYWSEAAIIERMVHEAMHQEIDSTGQQLWTHDDLDGERAFYHELARRMAGHANACGSR